MAMLPLIAFTSRVAGVIPRLFAASGGDRFQNLGEQRICDAGAVEAGLQSVDDDIACEAGERDTAVRPVTVEAEPEARRVAPIPLAVNSAGQGNVTIDGHTTYSDTVKPNNNGFFPAIDIPTLVRTGTGSIDIAAAGSFMLLDRPHRGGLYGGDNCRQCRRFHGADIADDNNV